MYTEVGSRLKALEFFQLWRFCLSTMRIKKLLKTIIYKLNTVKLLIFKVLKGHLPRLQSQVMAEMRNSTRWMQIRIKPEGSRNGGLKQRVGTSGSLTSSTIMDDDDEEEEKDDQ